MFNNYVIISSDMINKLQLKGNELLVFAVIHSFSRDGKSWYSGNRDFIQNFTGSSIKSIDRALENLVKKGFIERQTTKYNFNQYRVAVKLIVNNLDVDNLTTQDEDNLSKDEDNLSTNKNRDNLNNNICKLYTQENLDHLKHVLLRPYLSSVMIELFTKIRVLNKFNNSPLVMTMRDDLYIKISNNLEDIHNALKEYGKRHNVELGMIIERVDKVV